MSLQLISRRISLPMILVHLPGVLLPPKYLRSIPSHPNTHESLHDLLHQLGRCQVRHTIQDTALAPKSPCHVVKCSADLMYLFHQTAPVPKSMTGEVKRRRIFWCASKFLLRSLLFEGVDWRGVIPAYQPTSMISLWVPTEDQGSYRQAL